MNKKPNLAVVGATGVVGQTFMKVLEEKDFPYENLYLFASARSAGKKVNFKGVDYSIIELTEENVKKQPIDIALFSAGGSISEKFAPVFAEHGAIVVDNSSQWRMDKDVPLVVPEVNPEDVKNVPKGIIANPNCSTIQAMLPLKAIYDKFGIKRVIYSTYQAVSGSGSKGLLDLENGLKGEPSFNAYKYEIAGNAIPQIDVFLDNGYTKEEMKMVNETKKILHDDKIKVTATTVRIPVFYAHSESINIETEKPFEISEVKKVLADFPGLVLQDDPANAVYPLAKDAAGKNEVFVGRVRRDESVENGINLWCVADNIRKGAATNTIQIAELLLK
jgi:aspartate-semialdehyde dehydrogenase